MHTLLEGERRGCRVSGGHFDNYQWYIKDMADSLEEYINGRELDDNEVEPYIDRIFYFDSEDKEKAVEYIRDNQRTLPNRYEYSEETIAEFKKGLDILRRAYIYAQRIDWLLSGDDREKSFHERLKEELDELEEGGQNEPTN